MEPTREQLFLALSGIPALRHRIATPLGTAIGGSALANAFLDASFMGTVDASGFCSGNDRHISARQNSNGKNPE
jgi:hypothetical protein